MASRTPPGLYKRGRIWWVRYSVNGRRFFESTKTDNRRLAEQFLNKRKHEIWHGETGVGPRVEHRLTLAQLRNLWCEDRSGRWEKSGLPHWKRMIDILGGEGVRADRLRARDIEALKRALKKEDLAPATINRHLAVLSGGFAEALRRELVSRNPCTGIKRIPEHNQRDRIASDDEIAELLQATEGAIHLAILFGVETGMRRGEIAELEWERIDLKRRLIRLRALDTKTKKPRDVPISKPLNKVLRKIERDEGRLIALSANAISLRFSDLCRSLQIKDLTFHDLRHTCATRLRRKGVDVWTIMKMLGHKSPTTALRYQTVDAGDMLEAIDKVG